MKNVFDACNVRWVLVLAAVNLAAMCFGCASQQHADQETLTRTYPGVSPTLLLDTPGAIGLDGQLFTDRSDWPATEAETHLGQVTHYQTYWYDRQSARPHYRDYTYRLFRSRTKGQRIR